LKRVLFVIEPAHTEHGAAMILLYEPRWSDNRNDREF
jgi:hypothetical protein